MKSNLLLKWHNCVLYQEQMVYLLLSGVYIQCVLDGIPIDLTTLWAL